MNHCECNMNCDPHLTTRIKHVYGNVLRLAIPLTLRSLMKDGDTIVATDSDFIPSSDYPVNVVFGKGKKNYSFAAEMDGNIAVIEEKGKIPVGTYDITVECRDDLGQPYRFKKDTVLQVVDVTAEAGIEPTIEYEAQTWYLDAAVFLATTEIGSMSEEIERRLEDVFGDVDYDAENKVIKFYDKNKTHVLGTLDSTPFVVDGTVDDVYIDVSRQVLVVILNEDAGGRRFSVPLYLVFDNYYKKDEVDSKVGHKADVLGDGRLPGSEATPVVFDYIYAPPSGSPIIPINPQAGEVIYFANEHKIRRYYYEDAGQSGGLPAIVYVEETPSRYVVYHNKRDEKFYRYDAGSLSMVEIETVGGGGEGTVTGVKVGSTTYEPTNGVVDISAGIPDVSGFVTAGDVADAVADLVDSAPATLDTLNKLAAALGDDPNFATTMTTALGNKVDKVTGKGLSTEDYTSEEKTKLSGIATGAEVNVQADWNETNTSSDAYIANKPTIPAAQVQTDWNASSGMGVILNKPNLATVATSGSYTDLSNKPNIPTKVSDLTNDSGFTTNTGTLTGVTFNGTSATVSSGVAAITATIPTVDSTPTQNSTNAVQSGAVYTALAGKQATLVKGTNLDATPTNGSDNPVTSDGVYDAIAAIPAGADGKSAYQSYLDTTSDSPVKTEAEWVASLLPTVVSNGDMAIVEGDDYIDIFIYEAEIATTPTIIALDGEAEAHKSATLNVVGSHLKADIVVSVPTGFYIGSTGTSTSDTLTATGGSVNTSVVIRHSGNNPNTDITGVAITLTSGSLTKTVPLSYTRYAGPTILADSTLTIKAAAGQSNTGSLQVTGLNLTAGINATVSGTGFTVSASESGTYGNSASLPSSGGTLYVKFSPTGSSASTGTLTLSSTGATSKTVDLAGAVATLTVTPQSLSFSTDQGVAVTDSFTIEGTNLTNGVTLALTDANSVFSLSKNSLTKAEAEAGEEITVTYNSSNVGSHSGSISVVWDGGTESVTLSGTAAEVPNFSNDNNHRLIIGGIAYGVISDGNGGWKDELAVYNKEFSSAAPSSAGRYTGEVIIPSKINALLDGNPTEFDVTTINAHAFNSSTGMTKLVIPDSVTSAGAAFLYITSGNLKYLSFGNGLINAKVDGVDISTIPTSGGNGPTVRTGLTYLDLGTGIKRTTGMEFKMAETGTLIVRNPDGVVSLSGNFAYSGSSLTPTNAGYLKVPTSLVQSYKDAKGWGTINGGGWYLFDPNKISAIE